MTEEEILLITEEEIEALDAIQQREIEEMQAAAEAAELYFTEDITDKWVDLEEFLGLK